LPVRVLLRHLMRASPLLASAGWISPAHLRPLQ